MSIPRKPIHLRVQTGFQDQFTGPTPRYHHGSRSADLSSVGRYAASTRSAVSRPAVVDGSKIEEIADQDVRGKSMSLSVPTYQIPRRLSDSCTEGRRSAAGLYRSNAFSSRPCSDKSLSRKASSRKIGCEPVSLNLVTKAGQTTGTTIAYRDGRIASPEAFAEADDCFTPIATEIADLLQLYSPLSTLYSPRSPVSPLGESDEEGPGLSPTTSTDDEGLSPIFSNLMDSIDYMLRDHSQITDVSTFDGTSHYGGRVRSPVTGRKSSVAHPYPSPVKTSSIQPVVPHLFISSPRERARTCTACFEALSTSEFPQTMTSDCNHAPATCIECTEAWISTSVENGLDHLSCPDCNCTLQHSDVQRLASPLVFDRYDSLATRAALSRIPDFIWCLNSECGSGQIHSSTSSGPIMTCVACAFRMCVEHGCEWHEGETCTQYDTRAIDLHTRETSLKQSLMLIFDTTKRCPGRGQDRAYCGWNIEKNLGCDHMACKYAVQSTAENEVANLLHQVLNVITNFAGSVLLHTNPSANLVTRGITYIANIIPTTWRYESGFASSLRRST